MERREGVRAKTCSQKRTSKRSMALGSKEFPDDPVDLATRPSTLGDCHAQNLGSREHPCPWVSCPYHLYLEINEQNGSIKFNFPDKEVDELEETCSLRVAEYDGQTLEQVGDLINITRERVRQIEGAAFVCLRRKAEFRDQACAHLERDAARS